MKRLLLLFFTLLAPAIVFAAQYSGTVRAADLFLPGATITARLGGAKVVGYTDEEGRFSLDLAPGVWDIEVSMFGFPPARGQVDVGNVSAASRDWVLEMPRYGEKPAEPAASASTTSTPATTAKPADSATAPKSSPTPATTPAGQSNSTQANPNRARPQFAGGGRGRFGGQGGPAGQPGRSGRGQNGQQQQPGFQNVSVTATEEGQQDLAAAAAVSQTTPATEGDLTIIGSSSGGLQAGAEEQARRERMGGGRGGPGGPGVPGGDMAAGSSAANGLNFNGVPGSTDGLGMNQFGAAGAAAGFGADNGGGFGPGPGGGGGGGGGPRGGGGPGGGGGGRGGGGRGGFNQNRPGRNGRAPFNGQFAAFGNRRRTQPAYTGSIMVNANDSALNAAPFALNGQAVPKPSSERISTAGNVGGPLRIPKLVTNDKWFVYLTLQGTWNHSASDRVGTLPSAAERSGDFSDATIRNTPITIFDPQGTGPFPGNIIPTARMSPAALGLLPYFPNPTSPALALNNYSIGISTPSYSNAIGGRVSGSVSNKDRLNFNEQYSGNHSNSEQLFGFLDTASGYGLSSTAGWSHSFKPRLNNSANFAFSRNVARSTPYFAYTNNVAETLGITGTNQDPIDYGPPNLSFTNFSGLSDGTASLNRSQTANFTDTLTFVVHRQHNLQFGFGYRRMQQNTLSYANSRGSFSFSGLLTSALNASGQPQTATGMDFADFLLGLPQSSSVRINNSNDYFRGWATNWYAQDDWRINRGLSLNLGLRYEYFSPYTELRGRLSNLDINGPMTAVAQVTSLNPNGPYTGSFPSSLVNPDKNNFSPRLGFAFRPSQKHSRVIRGGYSIFFSGSAYGQIAAKMAAQPPFATTASLTTSSTDVLTLENGFALLPSQTITNTYAIDKNYKLAYAQSWAFAIQQTLPHSLLVELEYIGTKGTGLDVQEQPNRAAADSSPLTASQNLQIANATGFTYETDHANSIYHAGQVRLTRRFSRGMSAMMLYTFSKSIDDASTFSGGGSGTLVQNPFDLSAERGLSSFDHRHNLSLTYMASSPVGIHGLWRNGGWKTKAFAGWTVQGTFTANSGAPLTATVSGNLANVGGIAAFGSSRAQATGLPIHDGNDPYFNLLAFTTPFAGQFGNAGRDTIPGPLVVGFNSSLNRAWRFGDTRRQLQLRISANNVLNHVEITNWGTTVNAATYGLPTGASGTRTVQVMTRFNF
ncbi:MAG TPA: TonB-dependent receptor [Bryobacteraceae bacterium]|nr:TonB-dependent receptor [Bryobacteraceae bacterium]